MSSRFTENKYLMEELAWKSEDENPTPSQLAMYKEKKGFISALSETIKNYKPRGLTVEKISYEVYKTAQGWIREWIVVTYYGGGFTAKIVSGNSNSANFKVIAEVLDGGDYSEVPYYLDTKETAEEVEV